MTVYQLQRCAWDAIRAAAVKSENSGHHFDVGRYDLTEDERRAIEQRDITALYRLGLHPVLLNAFARMAGFGRDDYRKLLQVFATDEERTGRWQK
jgi:hypothetical protein